MSRPGVHMSAEAGDRTHGRDLGGSACDHRRGSAGNAAACLGRGRKEPRVAANCNCTLRYVLVMMGAGLFTPVQE